MMSCQTSEEVMENASLHNLWSVKCDTSVVYSANVDYRYIRRGVDKLKTAGANNTPWKKTIILAKIEGIRKKIED